MKDDDYIGDYIKVENIRVSGDYIWAYGQADKLERIDQLEYASGEAIKAYDNTGEVLPTLTTGLIYDFFRELALEAGQEDFASMYYMLRSNQEYEAITRGNWLEEKILSMMMI